MPMRAQPAATPRRLPSFPPSEPPHPWVALLERVGEIENEEHIILLGRDGPDLMCALLRRGAPNVTHLCSHERLESESASMVIVPRTASSDWLEGALPSIRRALIPNGRLVVAVDAVPSMQTSIARRLKLQAFASVRAVRAAGHSALIAEVPTHGLPRTVGGRAA